MKKLRLSRKEFLIAPLAASPIARADRPTFFEPLLPQNPLRAGTINGTPQNARGQFVPVTGQPFTEALQVQTTASTPNEWDVQFVVPSIAPIQKGDALLGVFYARAVTKGAQLTFHFEQANPPWAAATSYPASLTSQWQLFYVPFNSNNDYAPGEAHLCIRLGFGRQTIQIGGLELRNYGNKVPLSSLPTTPMHYEGEESSASWRREAEERIKNIRMAPLTIRVVGPKGAPIKNARVHISMQRHAFPFGSAVAANVLLGTGGDNEKYRQMVLKLFNRATIENHLKWVLWDFDRSTGPQAVRWLRNHNISVRGHNLVWPSWRWTPSSLQALKSDPQALAKAIEAHIVDELTVLKGQCVEWDVVNEPVDNHELSDEVGGLDALVHWYQLAHQTDPTTKLFVNDYNILEAGGRAIGHQNRYAQIIQYLLDHNAPLQGIGLQCHFDANVTPPIRLLQILDRFAQFGLPLEVTELDITLPDQQAQAHYMRDFLTVAFSYPAIEGIVLWGFWAGAHWRPEASLFAKDWSLRPIGQAWQEMVFHRWWTDETLLTHANGCCTTRGFLGDYLITVEANGSSKTVPLSLQQPGTDITITLNR